MRGDDEGFTLAKAKEMDLTSQVRKAATLELSFREKNPLSFATSLYFLSLSRLTSLSLRLCNRAPTIQPTNQPTNNQPSNHPIPPFPLTRHEVDTITKVAETAAKEYAIKVQLDRMEEAWKPVDLEIVEYRNTGTAILLGVDTYIALLDEQVSSSVRGGEEEETSSAKIEGSDEGGVQYE